MKQETKKSIVTLIDTLEDKTMATRLLDLVTKLQTNRMKIWLL